MWIESPVAGAVFAEGQGFVLDSSSYDIEDGLLAGSALSWSSSIDGNLETGKFVVLSAADHRGDFSCQSRCCWLSIWRLVVSSVSSESSRISGISQICLLRPVLSLSRDILAGDWVAISWLFRFCTIRSAVLCVEPMASARPATVKAGLSAIQRRAAAW